MRQPGITSDRGGVPPAREAVPVADLESGDTARFQRLVGSSVDELDRRLGLSARERELTLEVAQIVAGALPGLIRSRPDNDRIADLVAGHHLTRQGLGSGATITRSPLGGYQAAQLGGNASYYAAASSSQYVVTTGAFVVGFVAATTRNARGGIILGKYADPALAGKGWGVSSNDAGRFGFLQNGDLTDLNTDNYGDRVDDGRVRLFHTGRSVLGAGVGFVRTADRTPASVVGKAGDLTTNVATPFGLLSDNAGGGRLAAGDHQVQAIAFWTGTAAENVVAHVAEVEAGLATGHPVVPSSLVQDPQVATPARSLGVAFQPNAARPCWCSYTIEYGSGGQTTAYVALKSDAANPPTTVRARSGGGVGVAIVTIATSQLAFLVPAGWYVKLDQVDVAAGGTCTIREQVEIAL